MRSLYRLMLAMHPPGFRNSFGDEMMSIFDQQSREESSADLMLDCLLSCARQWLFHSRAAVVASMLLAEAVQVCWIGALLRKRSSLSPFTAPSSNFNVDTVIALATVCLAAAVIAACVWTRHFLRRRASSCPSGKKP
jgi:hypothetical protein